VNKIVVKIGEYTISDNSNILVTHGLGSCVVVTLYDGEKKIGGMLHYLLPENPDRGKKSKYADTGIELLLTKLLEKGSNIKDLKAKLFGGSVMFSDFESNEDSSIGTRNIEKARNILKKYNIPIVGEDVGGNYSRSVEFDLSTGITKINSYLKGEKLI
jgi:chemotaxis protein CheD